MPNDDILNDRLHRLRQLRDVVSQFEDDLQADDQESAYAKLSKARHTMEKAGDNVTDSNFDRFYTEAAGKIAGLAIGRGYDEYAERVFAISDLEPKEVE